MNDEKTRSIEHPLEQVLDLEEGSTIVPYEGRDTELTIIDEFDEKDQEIEGQFQEVYDAAMSAFDAQARDAETIEPKFRARNEEVAVQYLNTALAAAKEKATMKQHKDKMYNDRKKVPGPKTLNQNLIVADRNEILRHIQGNTDE